MKGRAIDFRTKGDAMYYFGDGRVNTLLDDVQRDMKQGNYYSAAEQFLYYVDHYYDEGIDDDESNENIDLQEKRITNPLCRKALRHCHCRRFNYCCRYCCYCSEKSLQAQRQSRNL